MIKKLLIACILLVYTNANAEILALLRNQAGGIMYFTDTKCPTQSNPYWKIIYSTLSGGQTIWGCWFYDSGMVHVRWDNGNTSAFDANDLTLTNKSSRGGV